MALSPRVVFTKITPPRLGVRTLPRPRLTQALLDTQNYRLTILQAGAGYGKTTALAALSTEPVSLVWYQVTEEDSDPLFFLSHLCHATRQAIPDLANLPLALLDAWDGSFGLLPSSSILDQYLNALSAGLRAPLFLILDDIHLVAGAHEIALLLDRLISLAPEHLHCILATRYPVQLPNLSRWRARGDVLTLDQSLLAFNNQEISTLFSASYRYDLTPDEAESLYSATEGWAIALQLIWQSLRSGAAASIEEAIAQEATSLDSLFDILATDVFGRQPLDVQEFMLISATLRELSPEACNALRGARDSASLLAYLHRQELFVVEVGDGKLRYQHIFHTFLRRQASPEQRCQWHLQAAEYFRSQGDFDAAIYHLLHSENTEKAADLLETYGAALLALGRLDTLAYYLDGIPPEILGQHPALLAHWGDLARLRSRFPEALGWYQQAEAVWREKGQPDGVSRALHGQARVYLDTVNPSEAEALLQRALRLIEGMEDRETQARLYTLLAENKLNAGHPEEAERLRLQAERLRDEAPSEAQFQYRILLRTGRLGEARQKLEARAETERHEPVLTPRAHRETLLLLSLVYAFEGQGEKALLAAQEGTRRGEDLHSPFVTAVGQMRQGHALMLLPGTDRYAEARQHFEKAIEYSRTLSVARLLVEAYWGLCRACGYQGEISQATQLAHAGLDIATQAGDIWIASLVRLSLGASLMLVARYEAAEEWLGQALTGLQECSDAFGQSAARLWLCLGWLRQKNNLALAQHLPGVLSDCRSSGYDFIFTRPSLLGPPDERAFIPLLIAGRDQGWEAEYCSSLLDALGLRLTVYHPGYRLQVHTLGAFQVWRGSQLIAANQWRREKARQLFQVLLTYRGAPLDRDQIIEHLWPSLDPATAQRNFKVTLNALYQVLEPDREPGSESAFILREGTTYSLRPDADLWLDAEEFVQTLQQVDLLHEEQPEQAARVLKSALALYQGQYLPDARYENWAAAEREHLSVLFLNAADRLSEILAKAGPAEEVIELCQRILAQDNCWERAYRHLMLAFNHLGDRGQVARTYQRCTQMLKTELDVSPSPETEALYQELMSG